MTDERENQPKEDNQDEALMDGLSAAGDQIQEDILELKKELDDIRIKSDEYLDGWQRARAEFANYKKRVEREREQMRENVAGNLLKSFLDVVDDLDRALKNRPQEGPGADWANGIDLIYRKLLSLLASEGVQPIEAAGQAFDPNQHEAITHEPNPDFESGQVIEVVQNGYRLGDRVLRPARVRVAR